MSQKSALGHHGRSHIMRCMWDALRCAGVLIFFVGMVHAVAAGSAPGASVSVATGFLSEAEIAAQLGQCAPQRCVLGSMRISADMCTHIVLGVTVPHPCVRMTHNVPMVFVEASDKAGHLSLYTAAGESQMASVLNVGMSPAEKTLGLKIGDMFSAAVGTHGRALNMLAAVRGSYLVGATVSLYNMCTPPFLVTAMPAGYAFASEGDHINGTEFGNWRGPISNYWFIPWLTPFTAVARAMETAGILPVDYFRIFSHGGQGTAYPATGGNPNDSRGLGLLDAAYDSMVPLTAPFLTHGPLDLRLGGILSQWAHNNKALMMGKTAMLSHFSVGGYVQSLYPIRSATPANIGNPAEHVRPDVHAYASAGPTRPIADIKNPVISDTDRVISAALWPRFTCCNYCIGSVEDPYRHFQLGRGFRPQSVITP